MASTTSPNMNLVVPTVGSEPGPNWANDVNADLSIIDSHNHSSGQGVQIQPNGININADLPFNSNNATQLRTTRFSPQNSPIPNTGSDVAELYVSGNELFFNDTTGGNQVQLTSNGTVNATSSGISSGTATASFSAGVLNVKSSSTSFGNVAMQSAVLANAGNLSNQLTLQAPTLSGSITETLPAIPVSQSFMTIDASGNMAAYAPINQGITRSNLAAVGQQISLSCGTFNSGSSPSGVHSDPITNLSLSITTTGRPVIVMLVPFAAASVKANVATNSAATLSLIIDNGTTDIGEIQLNQNTILGTSTTNTSWAWAPSMVCMDTPSAGTITYTASILRGAGATATVIGYKLMAYEL